MSTARRVESATRLLRRPRRLLHLFFLGALFRPREGTGRAAAMACAAKAAGVAYVIWSTLGTPRQWVPLSDPGCAPGEVQGAALRRQGRGQRLVHCGRRADQHSSSSFYWENLIYFGMGPRKGTDGVSSSSRCRGRPQAALHRRGGHRSLRPTGSSSAGSEFIGRTVGVAGDHLTGAEMAAALGRALGQPVSYYPIPFDDYQAGLPGADDAETCFQFNHDFADDFCRARSLELSRSVNPALQSFDTWLAANHARIPSSNFLRASP